MMTRFKPNEWLVPKTKEEAAAELKNKNGRVIAGGTGLYELAKRGMMPETNALIDIQGLGLEYAKVEGGHLKIGAASRFAWLLEQEALGRPDLIGFKEAIDNIKPVQVKNSATVGGAICISIPFLDFPPAVLGFSAKLVLVNSSGKERVVPASNFWLDYLLPDLKRDEILTEIQVPLTDLKTGSAFMKLGRTQGDFALVNVCVRLAFEKDRCKEVAIAMGGVANTPIRYKKAEDTLVGKAITNDLVLKAAETLNELEPFPSVHGSPWYKREISKVLVRDALITSVERAGYSLPK